MKNFKAVFGIHLFEMVLLSLAGVPRVILHDLSVIKEGTFVNALFVFVPILIWIVYILMKRVRRPFITMLMLCVIYGVFLAVTHQLLWTAAFPQGVSLGGNFSGSAFPSEIIIRGFAVISSLSTGVVMGVILGTLTLLLSQVFYKERGADNEV